MKLNNNSDITVRVRRKKIQSESEILIPNLIGVHHFEARVMIISKSVFDINAWVVSSLMELNATHKKMAELLMIYSLL